MAVAIVATVMTAGAMLPQCFSSLGAMMSAGAAALTTNVGIALVAGAIGSIASQAVGMALGVQESFSWKNVALSAIGAGVTAGLGAGGITGGVSDALGSAVAGAVLKGTVSQGIAVAVGLQEKFDWKGVAASAVGAALSYGAGQVLPKADTGNAWGGLLRSAAIGMAGGAAQQLVYGGKANWGTVAADAFGNALGSSVVGGMTAVGKAEQMGALEDGFQAALGGGLRLTAGAKRAFAEGINLPGINAGDPIAYRTPSYSLADSETPVRLAMQIGNGYYRTAEKGDTVSGFAGGNNEMSGAIRAANGLSDADKIYAGRDYWIPAQGSYDPNQARASFAQQASIWSAKDAARQAAQASTASNMGIGMCYPLQEGFPEWFETASTQQIKAYADRMNGAQFSAWGGKDGISTAQKMEMALVLPVSAAPLVPYLLGPAVEFGVWARGAVMKQLTMQAATDVTLKATGLKMLGGAAFSTSFYAFTEGKNATPAGYLAAATAGAVAGGTKYGLNYAAALPNTLIPLTGSNVATAGIAYSFGYGTFGWLNGPPAPTGLFVSGYDRAASMRQSWWTTPVTWPTPKSDPSRKP